MTAALRAPVRCEVCERPLTTLAGDAVPDAPCQVETLLHGRLTVCPRCAAWLLRHGFSTGPPHPAPP